MTETITADDLARRFLTEVGADPNNAALRRAVRVWKSSEGQSICGNNPWFIRRTTYHFNRDGTPAQILCVNKKTRACTDDINAPGDLDCNFSKFRTLDDGIHATAVVLRNDRYAKVMSALRAGNAVQFLRELGASGWAAGGYNNALVKRYGNTLVSYQWTLSLVAGSADTLAGSHPTVTDVSTSLTDWLKAHGKSVDDPITADDLQAYLVSIGWSDAAAHDRAVSLTDDGGFGGKPWSFLLAKTDVLRSLAGPIDDAKYNPQLDFFGSAAKAIGFFLDVENLGYLLAIVVGGGLALYGFARVAGIKGPSLPSVGGVPIPPIE